MKDLPYSLIEAMAGGCVPVASRLRGVTDFVVQDGKTGLLFEMGDTRAAAAAIRALQGDRATHARMSAAGRADVQTRFSMAPMAANYAELLKAVAGLKPPEKTRYGRNFSLLSFGRQWQQKMPIGLKNFVRKYLIK